MAFLGLRPASEGDRVTTLELIFDLVYVFAFTQVTGLMAHGDAPWSVLDGFIVFALLWWTWCSYSWVANMVRADSGAMRLALMVVTATMFVACLAIPEALHDLSGGLSGPWVLVVCYAVVRFVHLGVYLVVAGADVQLRRQVLVSLASSAVPAVALLSLGLVLGEPWQRPVWLVAVLYDLAAIFVTSRGGGGWVVTSAAHFAERHALVVILAVGESVVAIGVGAAERPVSWPLIGAAVLAVAMAIGMWLHYFQGLSERLEHGLLRLRDRERARAARDVFTYLHLPIVFGIICSAYGVEHALAHVEDGHLGATGAWALGGGLAVSLVAMAGADRRLGASWSWWRSGTAGALLVIAATSSAAPPMLVLGVVAAVLMSSGIAGTNRR